MLDDSALDELTYDLEEDAVLVRRSLKTRILRRGPWATVLFLYDELDRKRGVWSAPKIAVVRFQKVRGAYRKHASFPLGSRDEAAALLEVLNGWLPSLAATDEDGPA